MNLGRNIICAFILFFFTVSCKKEKNSHFLDKKWYVQDFKVLVSRGVGDTDYREYDADMLIPGCLYDDFIVFKKSGDIEYNSGDVLCGTVKSSYGKWSFINDNEISIIQPGGEKTQFSIEESTEDLLRIREVVNPMLIKVSTLSILPGQPIELSQLGKILVGKRWRVAQDLENSGRTSSGLGGTTNLYPNIPNCRRDDFMEFNSNGTCYLNEGATKCNLDDPQLLLGTWTVSNFSDGSENIVLSNDDVYFAFNGYTQYIGYPLQIEKKKDLNFGISKLGLEKKGVKIKFEYAGANSIRLYIPYDYSGYNGSRIIVLNSF